MQQSSTPVTKLISQFVSMIYLTVNRPVTFTSAREIIKAISLRAVAVERARPVLARHQRAGAVVRAARALVPVLAARARRVQLVAGSALQRVTTREAAVRVDTVLRAQTRVALHALVHVHTVANGVRSVAEIANDSLAVASDGVHCVALRAAFGQTAEGAGNVATLLRRGTVVSSQQALVNICNTSDPTTDK